MSFYDGMLSLLNPEAYKKKQETEDRWNAERCIGNGLTRWEDVKGSPKYLYLDAKSFVDAEDHLVGQIQKKIVIRKGDPEKVIYLERLLLPKEHPIVLSSRGDSDLRNYVCFNADIQIPRLIFGQQTMMGITPFECLTQRTGIARTKGHTIIAGLGLGWSLMKIHARNQVKEITVIEKDQKVLDKIRPMLKLNDTIPKKINWICGDMWEIAPTITADVLFADIWISYGDVEFERARLVKECPKIKSIWCWGTGGSRAPKEPWRF